MCLSCTGPDTITACPVIVLTVNAVYTLETKRRENDKKIIALYVKMKDMVAVLVQ